MHTNKVNGKKYIGITCKKAEHRWNNGKNYVRCSYFYNAIQKYGWDGFYHKILFEELSEIEAKSKEIELIKKHNTTNKNHGYNLTFGGQSNIPNEETRKKMSQAGKGRIFTLTHRAKISEANSKRILSKYTKNKISEKHKGKMLGSENPKARKIININTLEVFGTIREASKKYKITESAISGNCRGNYHSAAGFRWMYYDEYIKTSAEEIFIITNKSIGVLASDNPYNSKKVININTGLEFETIRKASKYYNLDCSSLVKCCKNKTKTCGGFKWMYYDDYIKYKTENEGA
jgi:hypothetical protein